MRGKNRSAIGITLGLCVGAALYGAFRTFAPFQLAFAATFIGFSVGVGARLGRSFGTPNQLRVIIFGTLFSFVGVEALVYSERSSPTETFLVYLLKDPTWLGFSLVFLVCGIVLGVRLLVGNDPVGDVLVHGAESTSGTGTPCPHCDSQRTAFDEHSNVLSCSACSHTWRSTN